jgi:hypothetical protein
MACRPPGVVPRTSSRPRACDTAAALPLAPLGHPTVEDRYFWDTLPVTFEPSGLVS